MPWQSIFGENVMSSKSTWTGAVNSDWDDPDNRSPAGVPDASSDVTIATGGDLLERLALRGDGEASGDDRGGQHEDRGEGVAAENAYRVGRSLPGSD
jgi:hypothetical protein